MKNYYNVLLSIIALVNFFIVEHACAQESDFVPKNSIFLGVGGSYNSINFSNQSTYGKGSSYQASSLAGGSVTGSADGSTGLSLPIQSQAAPSVQVGYFQHFDGSRWNWGGKLLYSYLGATSSKSNQLIPQSGGFYQGGGYVPFTGNYVVRSYEQNISHQFSLIPTVGHSFDRGYMYFGVGPTYSQIKTSINNITGFADIIGVPTSVTGLGNGSYYSSSQWVFGGAALIGATYFVDKEWFFDLSYSAGMTKNNTTGWGGPWSYNSPTGGPREGTNTGTSSGKVITQTMMLTLNKAF